MTATERQNLGWGLLNGARSAGDSESFQQKRSYMCNNARICSTLPPWWTLTPTLFTHMSPSSESLALVSNEVPKVRETGRNLDIPFTSPQLDARKGTKTAQNRRKYPKSSRKRGKIRQKCPPKKGVPRGNGRNSGRSHRAPVENRRKIHHRHFPTSFEVFYHFSPSI